MNDSSNQNWSFNVSAINRQKYVMKHILGTEIKIIPEIVLIYINFLT
jgi:hypothetical protein